MVFIGVPGLVEGKTTTGAEALMILRRFNVALKAPLFHRGAGVCDR